MNQTITQRVMSTYIPKDKVNHDKPLLESLKEPFEQLLQTDKLSISINGFSIKPQRPSDLHVIFKVSGSDIDIRDYIKILVNSHF